MGDTKPLGLDSPDLKQLVASSAFYDRYRSDIGRKILFEIQLHDPITVEHEVTPAQLDAILAHIQTVWTKLGAEEPHWSVVSVADFKADKIKDSLQAFNNTGQAEVANAFRMMARAGIVPNPSGTALEYGCGVGRVTRWLAPKFSRVLGVDVSANHLKLAREYMVQSGVENFEDVHVQSFPDIDSLPNYDFLYSKIVLQHNPPPVIYRIFDTLLAKLNPGGHAIVQIPTYCKNYKFLADSYIKDMTKIERMEMHVLPQHVIFDMFDRHNCRPIEVARDHLVTTVDFVSTTFLFTKRP